MFNLPVEIQTYIWTLDGTYKEKMDDVIRHLNFSSNVVDECDECKEKIDNEYIKCDECKRVLCDTCLCEYGDNGAIPDLNMKFCGGCWEYGDISEFDVTDETVHTDIVEVLKF